MSNEQFISDYQKYKSSYKLAELYGCSNVAIRNYAKKIGYDVNENKIYSLSEKDKQNIKQAYYQDVTSNELAEKYNVSRGMITKIWYDANLSGKINKASSMSSGAKKIIMLLEENKINYETEKIFDSCKGIRYLPFDFYVNNNYLIEYDGEQHYKQVGN